MTEVTIKAHIRKSKKGKSVTVKSYTRRVGKKGVKSPPKNASTNPGDEFQAKLEENISKYTGPKMTKEEIAAWDKAARRMTAQHYGKPKEEPKQKSPKKTKRKKDVFSMIEEGVSSFVDKFSKRKYKRLL